MGGAVVLHPPSGAERQSFARRKPAGGRDARTALRATPMSLSKIRPISYGSTARCGLFSRFVSCLRRLTLWRNVGSVLPFDDPGFRFTFPSEGECRRIRQKCPPSHLF